MQTVQKPKSLLRNPLASCLLALLSFCFLCQCQPHRENAKTAQHHYRLGATLLQKKDLESGLKHLLIAKKLDPNDPNIRNQLGVAYYLMGEYEHSILSFKDALSIKDSFSEAHNNVGRVYIDVKSFERARKHLQTASEDLTYPHKDKVWLNYGLSYFFEFKYEKSLNYFLKSIATNRRNCLSHSYYGRALVELERFDDAARSLDKAIYHCQGRKFDEPHYYGAIALFRLGQKKMAMARLQEAIKLYPKGAYRKKIQEMLDLMRITDS